MKYLIAIIGVFTIIGITAAAEILTLDNCLRLALERNPQVLASEQNVLVSKYDRYRAITALLPSAKTSASYTRLDKAPYTVMDLSWMSDFMPPDMIPEEPIEMEMGKAEMENLRLELVQPISLQLFTALSLANTGVRQKQILYTKYRLEIALNAQQTYCHFLQAKAYFEIAKNSKEQLDAHVTDLQNMFDQGMIHKKDLLSAQVQALEVELMILQAENMVSLSRSGLCMAIGYPQNSDIDIIDSLGYFEYPASLDSVLAWANRKSLDAKLVSIGVEASDKQVTLAWQGLLPSLAAVFSYDYNKPNRQLENEWYDHWTAVGALQWEVFNWGANITGIRKAAAQKKQMEFLREAAMQGIALKTRAAYSTMNERRKKLEVAQKELETAQENYRVTDDLFHAGAATNTELLDAHAALTNAKINMNNYLADYNIARATLEFQTGQLESKIENIISEEQ